MADTFGCGDIGVEDCDFEVPLNEGEDQIVTSALEHAQTSHPEIAANAGAAESAIRSQLKELMRQSKFDQQTRVI